jgi:hypothetical protein
MIIQSKIQNRKLVLSEAEGSKILWLAFTAVILLAFFFRFYRLADHPLGTYFDPAINGLDAIRLMQRGGHVLFFPTNGGRESPFIYLLIPFIWLFDTTPFSFRALTAINSLLTVALLFGFLRSVARLNLGTEKNPITTHSSNAPLPRQASALWFATLGSLVLATAYWHIVLSRLGFRAILVPMLSVPLFWLFLKGWTTNHKRWFILAGLFMGLEGYIYSAARLLPVILVLAIIPEFFGQSHSYNGQKQQTKIKTQIINLLIFTLTALVIYLPMGWYLLTHPAQFTARAFSVMVWHFLDTPIDIITEIGRNIPRVLGFFCCVGSPNPIFGLPNYPGLSPLLAPFLLLGLIISLKHWRHLFYRLTALWWLIGLIPSIAAIEAPHPLRMVVAVVPTAILVALGLIHLSNWLHAGIKYHVPRVKYQVSRFTFYVLRFTPYVLPLLLILLPLPGLFRAYFIDWTKLQTTQGVYDYRAIAIRDTIFDQTNEHVPLYLPLARFNDSPLLFYLSGSFQRQAALEVSPADKALVIAPEKNQHDTTWVRLQNQVATVLPPLTGEGQRLIQTALSGSSARPIHTVTGETVAHLAPLPTDPARFLQQPTHPLTASFGPIRLTGLNYTAVIEPSSQEVPVTLFWQATAQMVDEYEVVLHLVDDNRQVWGNGSGRPTDWVYPTTFWRPGLDEVASQHTINVETLAPGRYWLAISLFDPATHQRLPFTGGQSDSPDTLFTGPLKVPLPPLAGQGQIESLSSQEEVVAFGDVARLLGFDATQVTINAGQPVCFGLLWEAISTPPLDYTVFVHLLDENDNILAGHDSQPLAGHYPTSIWTPGERILDPHTLPTPDSLPPGQYRLAIGLYHQPTGERLPLNFVDSGSDSGERLILKQPVMVKE